MVTRINTVQSKYDIPRRDITVFLRKSLRSNLFFCVHCGYKMMVRRGEVWEIFHKIKSDDGFTYGYEKTSFPTTIRCGNKKCGIYWHFHFKE